MKDQFKVLTEVLGMEPEDLPDNRAQEHQMCYDLCREIARCLRCEDSARLGVIMVAIDSWFNE